MTTRPYLKARAYTWKAADRTETPGIGLMYGRQLRAHLTYTEARTLADNLHDMADRLEATRQAEENPKENH